MQPSALLAPLLLLVSPTLAWTQGPADPTRSADRPSLLASEFRTPDGSGNNLRHPERGAAGIPFERWVRSAYADDRDAPSGAARPNAREISNAVCAQAQSRPQQGGVSDFFWQWGQFLDHDLDLTALADPVEAFDVTVPLGDPWFDPMWSGAVTLPFVRSHYERIAGRREQVNEITAYIDGSNVYGSDLARQHALRTMDGTGRMKTSAGDLLPFNEDLLPNDPADDPSVFLAGDVRANEQLGLTAMHTVWVREHNFWAERLAPVLRRLNGGRPVEGELIFQWARAIVVGELQVITYREFLPILLGDGALGVYRGYDPNADASISNVFATVAYRFGHSMVSPLLRRVDANGDEIAAGHLSLAEAFFRPDRLITEGGVEPVLRGLASQPAQELDGQVIDELRNFLFGPPGAGGLDLAALNLQRGRDHGIAGFNALRERVGLRPLQSLDHLSVDPNTGTSLGRIYASVDELDPWLGGVCEDRVEGALVGPTFHRILTLQFRALRDGDRFWYRGYLPAPMARWIEGQRLSDVIRRNTGIGSELADDVFHVAP